MSDREYARKALKQFGPATGLIDLYPLELMQHLLEHVPHFLTPVSAARFLVELPEPARAGRTGEPIVLRYEPSLKIRGFAIRGGEKPGYVFEPVDPPGTYHLSFSSPGTFRVMISALGKSGVMIEELELHIAQGERVAKTSPPEPTGAEASAPERRAKDLSFVRPRKI